MKSTPEFLVEEWRALAEESRGKAEAHESQFGKGNETYQSLIWQAKTLDFCAQCLENQLAP